MRYGMKTATILRWSAAAAVAVLVFALLYLARYYSAGRIVQPTSKGIPAGNPPASPGIEKLPWNFTSNEQCKACHEEIWAEMCTDTVTGRPDEHPRAWFNGPHFIQDPKRTECSSCHASVPILENGLDKMIQVRTDRFHEGIGCIECHKFQDTVQGPLPSARAACNPRFNPVFSQPRICAPCHALHGTLEEWKNSRWFGKKTCQDCHMPVVERPSATGGEPRKVKRHQFLSARDIEFLRDAVECRARFEGDRVVIEIENDNTGHNFPGEIFNREVFLVTRMFDARDRPLALDGMTRVMLEPRPPMIPAYRESMKTVRRSQRATEKSTQIRPGEVRRYSYAVPGTVRKVKITLGYKFLFAAPDFGALRIWETTLNR